MPVVNGVPVTAELIATHSKGFTLNVALTGSNKIRVLNGVLTLPRSSNYSGTIELIAPRIVIDNRIGLERNTNLRLVVPDPATGIMTTTNGFVVYNDTRAPGQVFINNELYTLIFSLNDFDQIDGINASDLSSSGAKDMNRRYALMVDLTMDPSVTYRTSFVGNRETPFTGIFEGFGHTISGMRIRDTSATDGGVHLGLFGVNNGTIRNLSLRNAQISTNSDSSSVGLIAGVNRGTVFNTTAYGDIRAGKNSNVGGLVGLNESIDGKTPLVLQNYSAANITAGTGSNIGGVVGNNDGNVVASFWQGLMIADGTSDARNDEIAIGGVVGRNTTTARIDDSFSLGSIFGYNNTVVGGITGTNDGVINRSFAAGGVFTDGKGLVGGVVGREGNAAGLTNVFWNHETTGQTNANGNSDQVIEGGAQNITTAALQNSPTIFTDSDQPDRWIVTQGLYPYLKNIMPSGIKVVSGTIYTSPTPDANGNYSRLSTTAENLGLVKAFVGANEGMGFITGANGYYYSLMPAANWANRSTVFAAFEAGDPRRFLNSFTLPNFDRTKVVGVTYVSELRSKQDVKLETYTFADTRTDDFGTSGARWNLTALDNDYLTTFGADLATMAFNNRIEVLGGATLTIDKVLNVNNYLAVRGSGTVNEAVGFGVTVPNLLLESGDYNLDTGTNQIVNLTMHGRTIRLTNIGDLTISKQAALGLNQSGVTATANGLRLSTSGNLNVDYRVNSYTTNAGWADILLRAGGDLTLNANGSVAGQTTDIVVGGLLKELSDPTKSAFAIYSNVNAANNSGNRWRIWLKTPYADHVFGRLDSNQYAIWNRRYGESVSDWWNRYVFEYQPTITVTSNNDTKTYGDVRGFTNWSVTATGAEQGKQGVYLSDQPILWSYILWGPSNGPWATSAGSDATADVGTYQIIVGDVRINRGYAVNKVNSGILTVNPRAITIQYQRTVEYGDEIDLTLYTVTRGSIVNGDRLTGSLSTTARRGDGVTGRNVEVTQGTLGQDRNSKDKNYNITFVSSWVRIIPRVLDITAKDVNVQYGFDIPLLTEFDVLGGRGMVGDDRPTGLFATGAIKGAGAGAQFAITRGTFSTNANYVINSFTPGVLRIIRRNVTVTPNAVTALYGDDFNLDGYAIDPTTPTYMNQTLRVNLTTEAHKGSSVGNYLITAANNLLTDNPNYNITIARSNVSITPRYIDVRAKDVTVQYGDDILDNGYELTSGTLIAGDSLTGTMELSARKGDGAGTQGTIRQGTLGNSNYIINSFQEGTITITRRNVSISANNTTSIYGEDVQLSGYRLLNGTQTYNGENLVVTLSTTAQRGSNVGDYAITATNDLNASNANYNITYTNGTHSITRRNVSIQGNDVTATYGENVVLNGFTVKSGDLVGNDSLNVALGTTATKGSDVGRYGITAQNSLNADNPNYNVTYTNGNVTISKRNVSVRAKDATAIYGEDITLNGFEITDGNTYGTDVLNLTLGTNAQKGSNVGAYNITARNNFDADNANYNIQFTNATFNVTRRNVSVKARDVTATYGETIALDGYDITSGTLFGTDRLNVTLSTTARRGSDVGRYDITAQNTLAADNSNYNISFSKGFANITKRNVSIKGNDVTATYGENVVLNGYTLTSGTLYNTDTLNVTVSSNAQRGSGAGRYDINAQNTISADNANYNITYTKGTVIINKRDLTVKANDVTATYGENVTLGGFTLTGGSLYSTDRLNVTLNTDAQKGSVVGRYDINAQASLAADNANYNVTFTRGAVTIEKRNVSIKARDVTATYGEDFNLNSYTITEGSLYSTDQLAISLTTAAQKGSGVGRYDINAQTTLAADNANYNISYTKGAVTINKRNVAIKANDVTTIYGEDVTLNDFALTSGTLYGTDALNVRLSTNAQKGSNARQYDINAQDSLAADNANYNISFTKGLVTIDKRNVTVKARDVSAVYGEAIGPDGFDLTQGSLYGSDQLTVRLGTTATRGSNVGSYAITANNNFVNDNSNYNVTYVQGTASITKRNVSIKANDVSTTYGEDVSLNGVTLTSGSLYGSDTLDVTLSSSAQKGSVVGRYEINAQNTLAVDNGNYNISFTKGSVTIDKRNVSIKARDVTTTYGEDLNLDGFDLTQGSLYGTDRLSVVLGTTARKGSNVGSYDINATNNLVTDNGNYNVTFTKGTVTIDRRNVSVKANDVTATYGENIVLTGVTVTGGSLYGSDTLNVSLGTTAQRGSNVGSYDITATNNLVTANSNYNVTFTKGTVTVDKRNVSIKANDVTSTYGENVTLNGTTLTSGSLYGTDTLNVTLSTVADKGSNVGRYDINAQRTLAADNRNYNITFTQGAVTIEKRNVSVKARDVTATYGDNVTTNGFDITEGTLYGTDRLNVTLNTNATRGSIVGHYDINAQNTLATDNGNYNITYSKGVVTIDKRNVSVKARDVTATYGDNVSANGFDITEGTLYNTDRLNVSLTTAATRGSNVGRYDITANNNIANDNSNYNVTFTKGVVTIDKRNVSIKANDVTATYGESVTLNGTTLTSGSLYGNDTLNVTLNTTAQKGSIVGRYDINAQNTLAADNSNYNITFAKGTVTIDKRNVSVKANDVTAAYGDDFNLNGVTLESGSLYGSDRLNVNLSTSAQKGSHVGSYDINAQNTLVADNSNYNITFTKGFVTIEKRNVSIKANDVTSTYGDDVNLTGVTLISGSLYGTDALNVTLNSNAQKGSGVGRYDINAQGTLAADNSNYNVTFTKGSVTIDKRNVSIKARDVSTTYGEDVNLSDFDLTQGSLYGTDRLVVALGTNARKGSNVGSYDITATNNLVTANSNYNVTFAKGTVSINKRNVTLTANDVTSTYGEDVTLNGYNLTSGTLYGTDRLNVSLNSDAQKGSNAGRYEINAQNSLAADNSNYNITFVKGAVTIDKRNLTVAARDVVATYGDDVAITDYEIKSGSLYGSDQLSVSLGKTGTRGLSVGTYDITGSSFVNPNYNVTFTKGTLTINKRNISVAAKDVRAAYGDDVAPDGIEVKDGSLVGNDRLIVNLASNARKGSNVGSYEINATNDINADNGNYNVTFAKGNITIAKRNVTVKARDVSAIYGENVSANGFDVTEGTLYGTGRLNVTLTSNASRGSDAGRYDINAQNTLATDNANYNITFNKGVITIDKRNVSIKARDVTSTYGDDVALNGFDITQGSLYGTDRLAVTLGTNAHKGANVGSYDINATNNLATANSNYNVTFTKGSVTINKRNVSITAKDVTAAYGDDIAANGFEITDGSLYSTDRLNVTLATDARRGANVGSYDITAQSSLAVDNGNYNVTFNKGLATITKRNVSVKAKDVTTVYGEDVSTNGFEITEGSIYGADRLNVTLNTSATRGTSVGRYDITASNNLVSDNANYNISFTKGVVTIDKRNVSVKANDVTTTYGDDFTLKDYSLTSGSLYGSDALNVNLNTTAQKGSNAGRYDITAQSSLAADNTNYNITFTKGSLTIDKRNVSIKANDVTTTYGDEVTLNGVTLVSGSLYGTDRLNINLSTTAQKGSNAGRYDINAQSTLGADNSNYNLSFTQGAVTIEKRNVSIKAKDVSAVYGEEINLAGFDVTEGSLYGNDRLNVNLGTTAQKGSVVGRYDITAQRSLAGDNANYNVTFNQGEVTIDKRNVSIKAKDITTTYGEDVTLAGYDITSGSLFGSDRLEVQLNTNAQKGSNVGTYGINAQSSLAADNANYNITYVNGTVTINKRNVSVKANDVTATYGEDVGPNGFTLTNGSLYGSDQLQVTLTTSASKGSNVGRYDITAQNNIGADNANYNISFTKGDATINKRNITVKANDVSAIYGDDVVLKGYVVTEGELFGNDRLNVTLGSIATKGTDVGSYNITATNDLAASNSNYNFTFNRGQVSITPRSIVVSLNKTVQYGDEIKLDDFKVEGNESSFVNSNLRGSLETTLRRGDPVGSKADVTIGTLGLDKSLPKNQNYIVELSKDSMIEIVKRPITVVADSVDRIAGDGSPIILTYHFANGRGTYNDEKLNGGLKTSADKNSPVGVYDIESDKLGEGNSNYDITFMKGTLRILNKDPAWQLGYMTGDGLGGLKVGYRIGGSNFYTRAVGTWDGTIADGEKPAPSIQPRFSDIMVCTNPESDCSISITAKDRQPVIFAR